MLAAKNEYLGKAYGKLQKISADKAWRRQYEERQKAILDYKSMMHAHYEEGYEKGETAGYERGEVAGYEKGETVGFERGENAKLKELIQKKLAKQKTVEQIAEELEEEVSVIEELIQSLK